MPRYKKRKQQKKPVKKLFFDRPYGVKLEELLDIYMKVIGNLDAELDMKIDKISISLNANRADNERIAHKLQDLQAQLLNATTTDVNGNYHYEQALFTYIFKNQIQTKFLADLLAIFNYSSELTEAKTIISNAPLFEVQRLQKLGYSSSMSTIMDQNKDIQHFATLMSLRSGKPTDEILQLGIANGLLMEKDDKLHFAGSRENVQEDLLEILSDLKFNVNSEEEERAIVDEKELADLGFQGGKIVFVGDRSENDLEGNDSN